MNDFIKLPAVIVHIIKDVASVSFLPMGLPDGATYYVSDVSVLYRYRASSDTWESVTPALLAPAAHNSLASIQGGTITERYHMSFAMYADLISPGAQLLQLHTSGTPTFTGLIVGSGTGLVVSTAGTHSTTMTPTVSSITTSQLHNLGGSRRNHTEVTISPTTLDETYDVVAVNSATPISIVLPSATVHSGREYTIKKVGAGLVTISCSGADTIDGAATKQLVLFASARLIAHGTTWLVI